MKYINAFFIAARLFAVAVGAQNRNVLADGNQPLTQTMVDRLTKLMEWFLDSTFSDEERSQRRSAVVSCWKNDDQKSIEFPLDTLAFEQNLAGAGEDQKRGKLKELRHKGGLSN